MRDGGKTPDDSRRVFLALYQCIGKPQSPPTSREAVKGSVELLQPQSTVKGCLKILGDSHQLFDSETSAVVIVNGHSVQDSLPQLDGGPTLSNGSQEFTTRSKFRQVPLQPQVHRVVGSMVATFQEIHLIPISLADILIPTPQSNQGKSTPSSGISQHALLPSTLEADLTKCPPLYLPHVRFAFQQEQNRISS